MNVNDRLLKERRNFNYYIAEGYNMADTREKILMTALQLFAKDGYEAVSVRTIAEELGMTKGALYRHYKNKRDIFDCIV